jgi:hypothetical protein
MINQKQYILDIINQQMEWLKIIQTDRPNIDITFVQKVEEADDKLKKYGCELVFYVYINFRITDYIFGQDLIEGLHYPTKAYQKYMDSFMH